MDTQNQNQKSEDQQDREVDLFCKNLQEVYQDFQILLPYAPYKKQVVPKLRSQHREAIATQFQAQEEVEDTKTLRNDSCDLVFVLDCTGSMQSWINKCKEQIIVILKNLQKQFKNCTFRAAFVAYRDHCDTKRIETFQFISSNYESLERFIGGLQASGGGDGPEDLAGGLNAAVHDLSWTSQTKNLFIIADAPCHGSKYHSMSDDYPSGCPKGNDIERLIEVIAKRGIDLSVLDINSSTDKMFSIFQNIYKSTCGKDIIRISLNNQSTSNRYNDVKDKSSMIAKTVFTSITGTTLGAGTSNEKRDKVQNAGGNDSLGEIAIRVLRTHKGLLNTQCLSQTELAYSVKATVGGINEKYANKKGAIDEEEEDSSDDEKEEKKESRTSKKSDDVTLEKKIVEEKEDIKYSVEQQNFINYVATSMNESNNWHHSISQHEAFTFSVVCITPYVEKRKQIDWNNPIIKTQKLTSKIKIFKRFFSEGAMRYAFYAYDTVLNQKLVAKLHKNLKDNSNFDMMKRDSMSLIACHYFADEFNSRILIKTVDHEEVPILINFVNSSIYEVLRHHHQNIKYYFVENYIEGDYHKYNNNAGWTSSSTNSEFNQISQAFSHFTWQYSQGQLLVVDIQGAELGVLTDPQIHTKNRSRLYGQGDLGYEGMLKFFHTHHCNQFCERLNLIHPILEGSIPNNFNFFSDLYGLEQQDQKEESKVEDPVPVNENKNDDEKEIEEIPDKIETNKKKQKKKRGNALKAEYEKQRLKEEEEQKQKEVKVEEKSKPKAAEVFVGTQCCLCKNSFFTKKETMIKNKLEKLDTLCEPCNLQCEQTLQDLACTKCGCLFKISKYYCRSKKVNLIGQCNKCRE